MNPKMYERNVLVTESRDLSAVRGRIDDKMLRLIHAALGLNSELSELTEAYASSPNPESIDWVNISEESGDANWYCAVAVNTLGFDHDEISAFESSANEHDLIEKHCIAALQAALLAAVCCAGDFSDYLKKHLFYGRPLDMEKVKHTLQQLCMALSGLCIVSGTTIAEARDTNIKKLRARYGDKFTGFDALNRNLEVERKILEEGVKHE